jgi:bifunctional ADP-heptose synthase (sugar kinase/adenylyltransferase)
MNEGRLHEILGRFSKAKIAVVGDYFLDKWLLIDRGLDEPSLETGLTAYQVVGKRLCPGAAGTVTNNLSALAVGEIHAVGFIGDDGEGFELTRGLQSTGVKTEYLHKYGNLFTPTYTKPLFDYVAGPEETHRLDIRNRGITPRAVEDRIIESLYAVAERVDAIIALDQIVEEDTGVITARVRHALADLGNSKKDLILYADSRAHTTKFQNIIVKCNHLEAVRVIYPAFQGEVDEATVKQCALAMAGKTGRPVFITWGTQGIVAVKEGRAEKIPAFRVTGPIDICGAGDAATAGIISALCSGATVGEAALIANITASITIQQIGTTGTATREGIARRFNMMESS